MEKKITLQDIANTANVTVATVHKALHNKKGVSPEKREEILALANSMNYYTESSLPKRHTKLPLYFPARPMITGIFTSISGKESMRGQRNWPPAT